MHALSISFSTLVFILYFHKFCNSIVDPAHCVASHTFGSNNESIVDWSREKVTTIVTIANLLHNICSYCFHIGVWDGLGIVGSGSWCRAFPIQHIGDWPNSLDCTDLNQCGVRRYAELCSSVTNKQTNITVIKIRWVQ